LYPGAFNPLHEGHRRIAKLAAELLSQEIHFEISVENVDKPRLSAKEIGERLGQFDDQATIWLTRAATFVEKAQLFPKTIFVVGADTLLRIGDDRYYEQDAEQLARALNEIQARGCRFLVFGRIVGASFRQRDDLPIPAKLRELCDQVPPEVFRMDISSTELRRRQRS
jgi:nicotinic acid mononucleotide adenylyltransferase